MMLLAPVPWARQRVRCRFSPRCAGQLTSVVSVNHEAQPGNFFQLPVDIERGYDYEEQEARAVYRAIR
jgi:hypothetical protein